MRFGELPIIASGIRMFAIYLNVVGNVADFEPQCRVPKKRHLPFKKPLQEITSGQNTGLL